MRAVDECECVRLSRASFERLLRPVRAKLKEAVAKYPVVQTEKEGGEIAGVPEEYARRVGLRAVVHGVIEAVCTDRPDAVLPWLRDHLVTTYAGSVAAAPPKLLSAALGPWKSRDDVDANKLQAYLGEMGVREFLAVSVLPAPLLLHLHLHLHYPLHTPQSFVEIALKDQPDNLVIALLEYIVGEGEVAAPAPASAMARKPSVVALVKEHPRSAELFEKVSEGDVDGLRELLADGVPAACIDEDGNTALIAAAEGESECAQVLIEARCPVDHQNDDGVSALMKAVEYEDIEVVRIFLAAGASLDAANNDGATAVEMAKGLADPEIYGLLTGTKVEHKEREAPAGGDGEEPKRRNSVSQQNLADFTDAFQDANRASAEEF